MSGYRTLHREGRLRPSSPPDAPDAGTGTDASPPLWSVVFSPCRQSPLPSSVPSLPSPSSASAAAPLRFLTSSADGTVRAYSLADAKSSTDATAVELQRTHVFLGPDQEVPQELTPEASAVEGGGGDGAEMGGGRGEVLSLGCAAVDCARNYGGSDSNAGAEVTASSELDGTVRVWVRDEQPSSASASAASAAAAGAAAAAADEKAEIVRATHEFKMKDATGTTLAIRPPSLGPISGAHSNKRERPAVTVAVGCLDGSIALVSTGVALHVRTDENLGGGGDTNASAAAEGAPAPPPPGTVYERVGAGSSLPLSLCWSRASDAFAVGRKDGTVDVYAPEGQGSSNDVGYRRVHRILSHHRPVRALSYTSDGALLIAGDDGGTLTLHDVFAPRPHQKAALVGAVLNAHRSYVLDVAALPDGKRFVTGGADGTVHVWDVGTFNAGPVHTFGEGRGKGMVWGVASSPDGRRLVSGGDEGTVVVYSCEE